MFVEAMTCLIFGQLLKMSYESKEKTFSSVMDGIFSILFTFAGVFIIIMMLAEGTKG